MVDVVAFVNGLPLAIKAGWLIWMAWAAAQVVWYRRARVATTVAKPAMRSPVARRRPEPRPVRPDVAPAVPLPAIDLSSVPERPETGDESVAPVAASILGLLDPRASAN